MNVNVVSNTENKLLDRKEIDAEINFDGATPKREELKAAVCQKIALSPDLTVLRKVENSFGTKSVRVTAYSYTTKEALEATEAEYVKNREGMKKKEEEKKPEEAAAAPETPKEEAKPEEKEAPKEEKKEEPKAEEKKEEPPKEEKKEEAKPEEKKEEPKAEEK